MKGNCDKESKEIMAIKEHGQDGILWYSLHTTRSEGKRQENDEMCFN